MKYYYKYTGILILIISALSFTLKAQNIEAGARLNSATIKLGDQTVYKLSIHCPENQHVVFPVLKDTLSGKIQIVQANKADTITDKTQPGYATYVQSYTVTSFDSGSWVVSSYSITANGVAYKTPVLGLQVQAVTVDTTKAVYDIKQPIAVKYTIIDWLRDNWLSEILVIMIILLIAGIIFYIKKRPAKTKQKETPIKTIPAHIEAISKLNAIKSKKLWQADQIKEYYSEISDVVREYLERRYNVNAMEQTSDEIFTSLRYKEISGEGREELRQILVLADLVKFAREKPLPTDHELTMENALGFVRSTQPIIIQPTETKEEQSEK